MLQQETRCEVADNSGAKIAYVIRVYGSSTARGKFTRRTAHVGDREEVGLLDRRGHGAILPGAARVRAHDRQVAAVSSSW